MSAADFANLNNNRLDSFLRKNRFPRQHSATSIKKSVAEGKLSPVAFGIGWIVTMVFKIRGSQAVRSM